MTNTELCSEIKYYASTILALLSVNNEDLAYSHAKYIEKLAYDLANNIFKQSRISGDVKHELEKST